MKNDFIIEKSFTCIIRAKEVTVTVIDKYEASNYTYYLVEVTDESQEGTLHKGEVYQVYPSELKKRKI